MADTDVVLGSDDDEYSQTLQQWDEYIPVLSERRGELGGTGRRTSGEPFRKRIKV